MRMFVVALPALLLGGCFLPMGIVEHYKPDPRRDEAVRIDGVGSTRMLMADGRGLGIAGVNLQLPTADPALERDLRANRKKLLDRTHVLVRDLAGGEARLTAVNQWRKQEHYEGLVCPLLFWLGDKYRTADVPVGILIPIIVTVDERWDVGEALLRDGLATVGPGASARYRAAEERARRERVGLWMGPNERMLDLIRRARGADALALLKAGANPNAADGRGTALSDAISQKLYDLALALLDRGAEPDKTVGQEANPPLLMACQAGTLPLVRRLIEQGADVNRPGFSDRTPLHSAAAIGSVEIVRLLLESGARIDQATLSGMTALGYAAEYNRREVARLLIDRGADIHGGSHTPLQAALGNGQEDMAEFLRSRGAKK